MKNNSIVSLIVPCYNEEANIQKGVLDKIGNYTKNNNRFIEVIIVDDGSSDSSKKIIKERYLPQFPKFKLVENSHQGKAIAVITGIKESKGNYVMFSDIDLATPIEEVERLIKAVNEGYDIIIGSRTSTREGAPLSRKILTLGSIVVRSYAIGLRGIHDTQCGFKIFKKDVALKIISKLKVFRPNHKVNGPSVSAGFDLEFLFLATKLNYKIKEVPVIWRHVETKNVNFIHDAIESLKDIAQIKYYHMTGKYDL
ncbi:MAG: glycosyltransferase [Candidatus Roizmanbacteria bacterium]|nr:MAG: glycosyltransferase [Candidatus Roizmanbacteria bacterium]